MLQATTARCESKHRASSSSIFIKSAKVIGCPSQWMNELGLTKGRVIHSGASATDTDSSGAALVEIVDTIDFNFLDCEDGAVADKSRSCAIDPTRARNTPKYWKFMQQTDMRSLLETI